MNEKRFTIRDVAKLAGVSPITVSRVINNSGYASKETRKRVEAAVAELNYFPNRLARSLRSKRTNAIGLIVTDITNPFWTVVVRGAEDAASTAGFSVILCNTDESEAKQEKQVNILLQKQVDGFLLVPARGAGRDVIRIQKQKVPVVVLDRRVPMEVDMVRADSEGGSYKLIQHLAQLGHRRIVVLSGPAVLSVVVERIAGYRRALAEVGQDLDDSLIFYSAFSQNAGYEMAQQALTLTPRPTAMFALNNFISIGAIRGIRDAGLRVPEDVAVVGFDDLPQNLVIDPFLTAAVQPAYEMGRRATELLLSRLSDQETESCQEIVLPTKLVIRRSSGGVLPDTMLDFKTAKRRDR